jgi:hypothetical protein
MTYPLVRVLADDGIAVALTCRVLVVIVRVQHRRETYRPL